MSLEIGEHEVNEEHDSEQREEEEDDGTYELIRKVESRSFLYNSRDPKHSKRDVISDAWNEIATGLKIKGKQVNGTSCRKKWKTLRDYYYKVKRTLKGKSGDAAKDKKPWTYYSHMDRVLSSYNEENENTQSNFPGDDSNDIRNESSASPHPADTTGENESSEKERTSSNESTPTAQPSNTRCQKRKYDRRTDTDEKLLNEKILKVLEEPEEIKDQFYHFGMTICNRLRNAPPQTAELAMVRISSLLYETMYPVWPWDNSANQPPFNESTHATQL